MSSRTIFISRLVGLYCLLVSLSMFTHKQDIVDIDITLVHSPALLFIVGSMTLVTGLAIVLGHNVWSGRALPVVVTLFGWTTLIKGLLCLVFSSDMAVELWGRFHYEQLFYLYASIAFALGAYLTYEGFRTRRVRQDVPERRNLAA